MIYIWIKAVHIIFVIAWVAGMLILPRYKIHQLSAEPGSQLFETMSSAAIKLRKIILTPALIVAWALGITMLVMNPALLSEGWIHAKLLLLLCFTGLHGYLISISKKVDQGMFTGSQTALKLLNELPFILVIVIVILAVVKPF